MPARCSRECRPPQPLRNGFILSEASLRLQSSWPIRSRLRPCELWHLPWDFSLYRDISSSEPSTRDESYLLSTFRPQRSSRSRRFTPRTTSRAYFIPKPRLRFTLQGFSLLPSRCTSSMPRSLMSLATFAYHSPKLVTPARAAPPSGPCAGQQSVTTDRGISPANNPIPS
jgi:hypothetical protein